MSSKDKSWVSETSKQDELFYLWLYRTGFDRTLNTDAKARFMFHQSIVDFLDENKILDKDRCDIDHEYHDGLDTSIFETDIEGFGNLLDYKYEIFNKLQQCPNITAVGQYGPFLIDGFFEYSPNHFQRVTITLTPLSIEVTTRYAIRHISTIVDFINCEISNRYHKHNLFLSYDLISGEWVLSGNTDSIRKINIHLPAGYDLTTVFNADGIVTKMVLFKDGWSIKNVKNLYHLFDNLLDDQTFMTTIGKAVLKQKFNVNQIKWHVKHPAERRNIWAIRARNTSNNNSTHNEL